MSEPIISVSGLRGIVGVSLTPEVALRYACAFASQAPAGPIFVTRDGRGSGPMLAAAITAGLKAVGREVVNAGIAATPTTGVLVKSLKAAGAIQISASHNPAQYNGMKLFSADGRVLPAAIGQKVLDHYRSGNFAWSPHDALGVARNHDDTGSRHLQLVLARVDADKIRQRKFRVVLDANHGAGSLLGRRLCEELNCQVTLLGGEPDGKFDHTPEPTAENLAGVLAKVTAAKADVGFCQDPDADRLTLIDECGHYIGEEYTLALAVDHHSAQRRQPALCPRARGDQLFDQPHERGPGREIRRAVRALRGGRGQRGRRDAQARRGDRRRRQRRSDRSASGVGARQHRGHGA